MDWNAKSPSQWDWEHLYFLNTKATETPRLQQADWSSEADREINVRLLYASGGSGCSGSEIIHASSSRSSKSTSINSSSNGESKTSIFNFEGSQEDSSSKKETSKGEPIGISPTLEPSLSGEPLLSLKLGKRLYFEDVCPGSDAKNLSFSGVLLPSLSTGKKGKSNCQSLQPPRCQVEGCNLDLSSAKDYHRKHRVCESHSKSSKVLVNGLERRFCQQCSRFHNLSEFDEKKRSCRRRLSDHNARRRKPQSEAVQLNSSAFSLSEYDGRQHMRPFAHSRAATNLAWQDIYSRKLPQTKSFVGKPARAGANNGRVHQPFNEMPSTFTMSTNDSSGLFRSKGIAAKTINPGVDDCITSSDMNAVQDFHRALSLLSSDSWGSYETKPVSLQHSNHSTHSTMTQPTTNSTLQRLPLAFSENWESGPQSIDSRMCISYSDCDNGNRVRDCQLFNAPYEFDFPCDQLD